MKQPTSPDILGPFPSRQPELKRPNWFEHIVVDVITAVVYTPLRSDDPRVTRLIQEYLDAARDQRREIDTTTPASAFRALQMRESVIKARLARDSRVGRKPRGDQDWP